jgi:acyl dehydratase
MPIDRSIIGRESEPSIHEYTWKDTVLYALGIGAKREELDFLYEGRGPKVVPTYAVVPKFGPMLDLLSKTGGNLAMIVHGGEKVIVHEPMAPAGRLQTTVTLSAVYDLRRLALVMADARTTDESGRLVAETTSQIIFRGEGGFGGETRPKESPVAEKPKDAPPSFSIEEQTSPEQALLYRLSGDRNPLHADPEFARAVGFEQGPILHGLCSLGFMARHVARAVSGGDASRIRGIEAQFRRPVWPGDTLVTEGWKVGDGLFALQMKVKERDEVVVAGAWATLRE